MREKTLARQTRETNINIVMKQEKIILAQTLVFSTTC